MALHAHPLLFQFEIEASPDLAFIPLCVRYNLDRFGLRISLSDWQRLPHDQRVRLACFALDSRGSADASFDAPFDAVLIDLMHAHGAAEPERFAPDDDPSWCRETAVPQQITHQCELARMAPIELAAWAALAPLQRYALTKLSRRPTLNHDFPNALAEFGLAVP